jgi:hypothetical protein
MATAELTPEQRRADLARRINLAREILRPVFALDRLVPGARIVRSAVYLLDDAARDLVDDDS